MAKSPYDDEDRLAKLIADAFGQSIQTIKDRVNFTALQDAINAGDINRALRLLGVSPEDFERVELTLAEIFREAGGEFANGATVEAAKSGLIDPSTESLVRFVFSGRNLRAERIIRQQSSELVTRVTDTTREAIRQNLERSLQAGVGPRASALDLVGTVNRATGKREGGIVGLTANQETYAANYRAEIASTKPEALRNALTRALRDKRFDRYIKKALETGEPIPAAIRAKMLQQYQNRMLKHRGDVIARQETLTALGAAHREQWEQAAESGKVARSDIVRKPDATHDRRTRPTHLQAEKMNADGVGFDQLFKTPMGLKMSCPYEGEIMCRCRTVYVVDYIAAAARNRRA